MTTTSPPPVSEPERTEATETKAYGDRHFKSVITPGVASSPILPESVSKFFRKLLRRTDAPAAH